VPGGSLGNHFLSCLSAEDAGALRPHLRHIALPRGSILDRVGEPVDRVIFPYSGAVSFVLRLSTGQGIEVGMIGRNGPIGGSAALAQSAAFNQAVVQVDLTGVAIGSVMFGRIAETSPSLLSAIIRWDQMLLTQAQQIAACNVSHGLEQRLCRWLAFTHDLIKGEVLPLTHDYLSQLLGVRRTSMTLAAQHLQEAGIIDYRRGVIRIRDRERLQHSACECYQAINKQFHRLLGWMPTAIPAPTEAVQTS
jgi:CRP-like cAMP-binding protein